MALIISTAWLIRAKSVLWFQWGDVQWRTMSSSSGYSEECFLGSVRYLLGRQRGEGVLGLRLRPRYHLQDLQGNGRCVQKHVQNQRLEFRPDFSHILSRQTPSLFCLMYKQGEQLLYRFLTYFTLLAYFCRTLQSSDCIQSDDCPSPSCWRLSSGSQSRCTISVYCVRSNFVAFSCIVHGSKNQDDSCLTLERSWWNERDVSTRFYGTGPDRTRFVITDSLSKW